MQVKVSQGMINQNLLTLTEYVNRGVVRIGEEFTVESDPPGEFFKTDIVRHGNKLRERGLSPDSIGWRVFARVTL